MPAHAIPINKYQYGSDEPRTENNEKRLKPMPI